MTIPIYISEIIVEKPRRIYAFGVHFDELLVTLHTVNMINYG